MEYISAPTIYSTRNYDNVESSIFKVQNLSGSFLSKISVWKGSFTCATTIPVTLSGLQTIDNVSLSVGDTVIVKDQIDQIENGIYIVSENEWTRDNSLEVGSVMDNIGCYAINGTTNRTIIFVCISTGIVGTDILTFNATSGQFNGNAFSGGDVYSVQYNDSGTFMGQTNFTYGYASDDALTAHTIHTNEIETTIDDTFYVNDTFFNPTITVSEDGLITNAVSNPIVQGQEGDVQYNNNGQFAGENIFNYYGNVLTVQDVDVSLLVIIDNYSFPVNGVVPGSYINSNITVDDTGYVTIASNGSGYSNSLQYNNSGTITGTNDILLSGTNITCSLATLGITNSGTATFVNGVVTVSHTSVNTNYAIFVNSINNAVITNKTLNSFRVTSYDSAGDIINTDVSQFDWFQVYYV